MKELSQGKMQYRRNIYRLVFLTIILTGFATPAKAQPPPLPHAFYGKITFHGAPAPVGVKVEVHGEGVLVAVPGNPFVTTAVGEYGQGGMFEAKLFVQGQVAQGAPLTFYVNNEQAQMQEPDGQWDDSFPFEAGGFTELNLCVGPLPTSVAPPTATTQAPPTATTRIPPTLTPSLTFIPIYNPPTPIQPLIFTSTSTPPTQAQTNTPQPTFTIGASPTQGSTEGATGNPTASQTTPSSELSQKTMTAAASDTGIPAMISTPATTSMKTPKLIETTATATHAYLPKSTELSLADIIADTDTVEAPLYRDNQAKLLDRSWALLAIPAGIMGILGIGLLLIAGILAGLIVIRTRKEL